MSIHTRCSRTAATIAAATATAALFVGASPANAKPAPEPIGQDVSVWTCPTRVDAVAQALRLQGFSAPAAKNFALFTKQDCTDITRATARPGPQPVGQGVSVWTCPTRVDAVAQALRLQGFSAPAAKNFAVFTREDCTDVT
jgi:rhodanese-related sulfurtransferase